jgi:hypothetical protein
MSYIINKTDGTVLTEVVDGTIDQITTDLTLIGKNSSTYGEFLNENFVKLLENFANTSSPTNPITGQLWFDTTENRLKIYDGSGFRVSGGTLVASTPPSGLVQGDIWIDSNRKQLFFYDGTQLTLAGPPYTNQQGLTGLTIESVLDTNQISHTVAFLYVNQTLLGAFSKDEFTPATSVVGLSGKIYTGFTAGTLSGMEFKTTATKAKQLIATDGSIFTAESFLTKVGNATVQGKFTILNSVPLVLGPSQNTEIRVTDTNFNIVANNSGQDFAIKIKNGAVIKSAIQVKATTERVGILTDAPTATLDVNGDTRIRGNLTVEGTSTVIQSSTLSVTDKNIELAKSDVPTDTLADGGGITLKGTSDHTILWSKDAVDVAKSNWTFSDHISLATGKTYKINNVDVITATSLGNSIASAPGLRSLGNLLTLTVDNISINDNTISANNNDGNIVLNPAGSGYIDASNAKLKNLADPVDNQDAVTLKYFSEHITGFPISISLDITGLSATTPLVYNQIATILGDVFPTSEHPDGTLCRVYATRQVITYPAISVTKGTAGSGADIIASFVTVNKGALQNNQTVMQDFSINPINAGTATTTYTRKLYVFKTVLGDWEFYEETALTPLPT